MATRPREFSEAWKRLIGLVWATRNESHGNVPRYIIHGKTVQIGSLGLCYWRGRRLLSKVFGDRVDSGNFCMRLPIGVLSLSLLGNFAVNSSPLYSPFDRSKVPSVPEGLEGKDHVL